MVAAELEDSATAAAVDAPPCDDPEAAFDAEFAPGFEGALAAGTDAFGITGLGAETPAMSDPSPSFCSVGASSLPVESMWLAD